MRRRDLGHSRSVSVHRYDWAGPIVVCKDDEAPPPGAFAARETPEGYLRVEGRINGCGVYEYENEDGESWGELRLKEHVGAPATLESWQIRPITDDHPPVWVDTSNVAQYQRGSTGSNVRFDGEYTWIDILITSPELIAKIKDGKTQLSCGYTCVLVPQEGEFNGVRYSYIQTSIYGNHVAVVDLARGGPMCSLVFDGAARRRMLTPDQRGAKMRTKNKPKTKKQDATLVTSEGEIEIPEDKLAAVMELLASPEPEAEAEPAAEAPMDQDEPSEDPAAMEAAEDEDEPAEEPKGDAARLRATIDMQAAELRRLKANFSQHVDARVALVAKAKEVCGAGIKTDGVSDAALRCAVIVAVNPDMKGKLKGKSAEYIAAAYEMAVDAHAKNSDSSGALMRATGRAINVDAGESLDALYNKMITDARDGVERRQETN